jgi:hypothetical protein
MSFNTGIAIIIGLLAIIAYALFQILKVLDGISGLLHKIANSDEINYVFRSLKQKVKDEDESLF